MKIQDSIQEQIHMKHVSIAERNVALSNNISAKPADLDRASFEYTEGISLMKHFSHALWLTALQKMSAARKAFPLKRLPN